jgi:hypothetical protein
VVIYQDTSGDYCQIIYIGCGGTCHNAGEVNAKLSASAMVVLYRKTRGSYCEFVFFAALLVFYQQKRILPVVVALMD